MNTSQSHYAGNGEHTTSYYAASANPSRPRARLTGDLNFDICVIGAGYSGLSAALHLAEKGFNVAIVEGARIGWGASGRNGGQIVNGLNASLQTIKRRYGADTASFVASLVMEGGDIIRERVKTYDIKCDLKPTNVFTAFTPAHMRELETRLELWRFNPDGNNSLALDEGVSLRPDQPVRGDEAIHLEDGRFAYALTHETDPTVAGLYIQTSLTTPAERIGALPIGLAEPDVAWSPDGLLAASSAAREVVVWQDGNLVSLLPAGFASILKKL